MTDLGTEPSAPGPHDAKSIVSRLLSFDVLIGGQLLKILYYVGLVGIVLWTLAALFAAMNAAQYSAVAFLGGLLVAAAVLIFGTLFWRFTCELWMVIFKIHDRLGEIRDRLPPR